MTGNAAPRILAIAFPIRLFLMLALLICVGGYLSYAYLKADIERHNERTLANLAESKANQIDTWIEERRIDAKVLSTKSHLTDLMGEWEKTGRLDEKSQQWMLARLKGMLTLNQYDQMMLLDRQGAPRLSTSGDTGGPDAELRSFAVKAMEERKALLSDLHWGIHGKPELDLVAPLLLGNGEKAQVVGAIYFHINPAQFLFPLIQFRPVASDSAETLLVRGDGEDVLFLNELRHRQGTTLTLRVPLANAGLVGVRAVRGDTGIILGKDYRNQPVVAYALPIKHLSWKMIAKIDEDELFAPVRQLAGGVSGAALLFLFLGTLVLLGRQRSLADAALHYKLRLENQTLESRFTFLSEFANDMILLMAEDGRILDANARAVESYGYTREELLKMAVGELRPAEQLPLFDDHWHKLLEQGHLVNEALHQRKDGRTFPVEVSSRSFVSGGQAYVQAIIRDIGERKRTEEALLGQRRFLHQIVDTDPNRILVTNSEGRYVLANKAAAEAYRMTPQEMVGRTRADVVPSPQAQLFQRLDETVQKTRRHMINIIPLADLNGKERWFLCIKAPMEQPDGTLYVLSISVDITESRQGDERLRLNEAKFRTLVEHLPHKIFMKDCDSVYTFCNTSYAEELGITPSDIVGKTDRDFYSPRLAAKFMESDLRVIESGEAVDAEERYFHAGQESIVHTLKLPLKGNDRKITGILGLFLDVTERRQTERALLESEQRYHVWLDVAPVACIVWAPETYRILEWNRMAETIFGWSREEVLGRHLLELLVPDEEMEKVQSVVNYPLQTGITSHSVNKNRTREGNTITCEWYNADLKDHDGHPYAGMSIGSDVTERIQLAALRSKHQGELKQVERLKVAGEMASGLTHELSQPLSAANNYLDACLRRMQNGDLDPDKHLKCIGLAHKQTERAGKIINHFKSLIRREEGTRAPLDLNRVVRDTAGYLEHEIERFGIALELDLQPLPEVVASSVELEQVLLNLMKNAIEAMQDEARRQLCVTSRLENESVVVAVGDSGKGIPENQLEQIFDQFHTTKRDGLGLGLAICRTIVTAHEGHIRVESSVGQGTTFRIDLPVADSGVEACQAVA